MPASKTEAKATHILLRDVARALEKHLTSPPFADISSVHWISVLGEENCLKEPVGSRPADYFETHPTQVALAHGMSEGSLITVYGQPHLYDRSKLDPLFLIKTLNGTKQAAIEVGLVLDWFEAGLPGLEAARQARCEREGACRSEV